MERKFFKKIYQNKNYKLSQTQNIICENLWLMKKIPLKRNKFNNNFNLISLVNILQRKMKLK